MSFSYDAGSSTPTFAGLVEFNSVRLNNGTFKTHRVPPLVDSPPVRDASTGLPFADGGYDGTVFYDPWAFDLECWLYVPDPDYVQAAVDYLKAAFNVRAGALTLTVQGRGWSASRQMTARVNGPIVIDEPDVTEKKVPVRNLLIPMLAVDPRIYSATLQTVTITTSTSVTNGGTAPAPFIARFEGPQTNPQINGPGSGNIIKYNGVIASGHYVEVNTNPSGPAGVTALLDGTTNAYPDIENFTATVLNPGSSSWTATNSAGAGATKVKFRDAYA